MSRGAPPLHAVILAGGAGERFWPASRKAWPKPLLEVVGGESLLDATLARARRFARGDRVWIVCGAEHARAMRRQSGLPASRVLVEPLRRNTAMAAAWVTQRIAAEDSEAVVAVLSADHHIPDARGFARVIGRAARAASEGGALLTLGVEPTGPSTAYGYIQEGDPVAGQRGVFAVRRFVEKPDLARARRYLRKGGYHWNAGIFVWTARVFLEEVERWAPALHRALAPLRARPRGRNRSAVEASYRRAPSLPVDVAILEKSRRVWTIPISLHWSDVGTWGSLMEELSRGRRKGPGNLLLGGELEAHQARGNLVWGAEGRLVALVGVENLAVVDTGDVILVTELDGSADVRRIVATLKEAGREELL